MLIKMIEGATRVLGKSQGYLGLPVRDEMINCSVGGEGTPSMVTAWEPTPDELARLNQGAPVLLRILGTGHPPVMIEVGTAPSVNEDHPILAAILRVRHRNAGNFAPSHSGALGEARDAAILEVYREVEQVLKGRP